VVARKPLRRKRAFPGVAPRTVRVRLYSLAREVTRRSIVEVPVPPGGIVARELLRALEAEYPSLGPVFRVSRFVRNDRYLADLGTRVRPGDEFAVHPPYGGG
jgi:molybdopterin converting factor small subunit